MKLLVVTALLAFSGIASAIQNSSGAGDPKCWCKTCNAMVSCRDNQTNADRKNTAFDKTPASVNTKKGSRSAGATSR